MADKSFTGLQLPNIGSGQARNPDSGFTRIYFKNNNMHAVLFDGTDVQLTGVGVSLEDLTNVVLTSLTSGDVLTYNGTNWVNSVVSGGGGASVSVSDTTPAAVTPGSLWWDSQLGRLFILYNDGDTTQWVEAVPASAGISLTSLSVGTNDPASGSGGISYNNTTGVFTYTPPDLSSYLTSETNDLTASVTWANVPDANITQSSVTQHQAALSITESQISDLGSYIALTDLSVGANATANGSGGITYNNTTGVFTYTPPDLSLYLTSVPAEFLTQTEGDARYLQSETNDLTASVTWANVPDANITQTSVTQHQAALSITESQISDLQNYLTTVALNDVSDVTITSPVNGQVLKYNGTAWVNGVDNEGAGGGVTTGKAIAMAMLFG